jgi:23S rRNA pseudouridine1911/1915/1917 synthase
VHCGMNAAADGPLRIRLDAATAGCSGRELAAAALGAAGAAAAERGGLWLDGRRLSAIDAPLPADGELRIHLPPGGVYRDAQLTAADLLYLDPQLMVVNKPAGYPVGAVPWDEQGSVLAAARRLLAVLGEPGADGLELAHQLDRGTSGVLVLVRAGPAAGELRRRFGTAAARKCYLAGAVGTVTAPQRLVDGHGRSAHGRWRIYPIEDVGRELPGGSRVRRAELEIQAVQVTAAGSLCAIRLITGRTHQIRLQLAARGHPLIGDVRYGGPPIDDADQLLLHAAQLRLERPNGTILTVAAPLPAHFMQAAMAAAQVLTECGVD